MPGIKTRSQLADELGISRKTLYTRHGVGWENYRAAGDVLGDPQNVDAAGVAARLCGEAEGGAGK